MDSLFRKYQWVLHLVGIAVAMFLVADIVNHVVASRLAPLTVAKLPDITTEQKRQPDRSAAPQSNPDQWTRALTARCLFGCADQPTEKKTCPGGCAEGEKCEEGVCVPTKEQNQQNTPDVPVESDLNVKLMGCMVASQSDYSLAMIQDGESQETYVVSVGDYLPGEAEVVEIERDRIYIRRNGQLEFIQLEQTIGGDPSPVSINRINGSPAANQRAAKRAQKQAERAAAQRAARQESGSGGSAGSLVTEQNGNEYVISRKRLEQTLENPEQVINDAQMIKNFKGEKESGLRVVGVTPDGIFSGLGIETNDVIRSVNGQKVDNPADAKRMFDELRESKSLNVRIERDGETVEKSYELD
jgi:general secretion pathway protein C